MGLLRKIWNKYIEFNKRTREGMKVTSSVETSFRCPKCKSPLFQIAYTKSYDQQYFCKKCGYEGMAKL